MKISIPSSKESIFRHRLEVLKVFPPYKGLRDRCLDVLALIQHHYYINKDKELLQRHSIVFNYYTMFSIREALGISEASLNNIKMELRKANIITSNELKVSHIVDLDDPKYLSLTFDFKI